MNLRVVMTEGKPGAYHLARSKEAQLTVTGPHGELLHKNIKMGARGSFNDSFALPAGADLGDWRIRVDALPERNSTGGTQIYYGTATFRIEEYKKPEFEVTVTPDKDLVRVGETMKMTIAGQYFFGGPVANAKVHYQVRRLPLDHPSAVSSSPGLVRLSRSTAYRATLAGTGAVPTSTIPTGASPARSISRAT